MHLGITVTLPLERQGNPDAEQELEKPLGFPEVLLVVFVVEAERNSFSPSTGFLAALETCVDKYHLFCWSAVSWSQMKASALGKFCSRSGDSASRV